MKRLICMAALVAAAAFAQDKAAAPSDNKAAAPSDKAAAPSDKAAAPAKMEMPRPPAEMSVEKWFVGSAWNCTGQQHAGPMGPEMKLDSRLEMKLDLAGFWMQVKGTMLSGPMKGKEAFEGFAGYDGTQHQRYTFQLGGMSHLTSKGWDGDKLVWEGEGMMAGKKMPVRHTIIKKGDNEFGSVMEIDGKTTNEQTCTRAAAAQK